MTTKTTINTDSVFINGKEYLPKDSINSNPVYNTEGLPLVMIRTYSAGVHFGYLSKKVSTLAGMEVTLLNARRVYQWSGAMTLSQLAMEGSTKQNDCKFTMEVSKIELVAIEIIEITEVAANNFNQIKPWKI